jgi:glycosyltransferase involved in cell wall biosynthesis
MAELRPRDSCKVGPRVIAVDASCLLNSKGGVGHYTVESVRALMALLPETEFHIFLGHYWARTLPQENGAISTARWRSTAIRVARDLPFADASWRAFCRWRFQPYVAGLAPDAVLAPNYLPPAPCERTVPVVHDMSHVRIPGAHPRDRVNRLRDLPETILRSPSVVTVSQFSKSEIVDLIGVAPDKIVVAPPGVGAQFRPMTEGERAETLHRYGLQDRGYFLAIGSLEPRKNLATLIAAYARLPAAVRAGHALVLGGGAGWGDAGLSGPEPERLRQAGQLRLLGYVPSADLPALYAGATAFCFPSVYEGFGMPVIEAMACATPVLSSNATAIPEAAGDAGVLLDPHDIGAWAIAMRDVAEDSDLARDLRSRGPRQAAQFTWARTALGIRDALAAAVTVKAAA